MLFLAVEWLTGRCSPTLTSTSQLVRIQSNQSACALSPADGRLEPLCSRLPTGHDVLVLSLLSLCLLYSNESAIDLHQVVLPPACCVQISTCMAVRLTAGALAPLQRWGRPLRTTLGKPLLWPSHLTLSSRNPRLHYTGYYCTRVSKGTSLDTSEAGQSITPRKGYVKDNWTVKMLFDGDCPLCMREVNMLRERNLTYKTIKFVDISAMDYSPNENAGLDFATAMGRIHAILPDGTILYDIQAFKKLYEAVGLGWVYAFTKIQLLARIADAIYSVWAKYRLPVTGRPPLVQILEERKRKAKEECESSKCRID
ncbi:hypothetical protein GOP47_0013509 [Adiantum capillus-veneris]|uniref:Thiol-disulfide oxidoreductase DCC n=1 Tax=Adiantum capillus-veneris TaxID=13818 RepID=A0A9D4ZD99_ADICA|nr:hypothetical protein GOP47_0013509 [Adiantum capillus-veneris]